MLGRLGGVGLAAMSLAFSSLAGTGHAQSGNWFQGYYSPTSGKVGYHFESHVQFYASSLPGGNACGLVMGTGITSSGTAPPGVNLPAVQPGNTYFEGTPQQPGDWTIDVTWHGVYCTQGPDRTNYGDRTIQVHLHFDGDAVRGVN